MKPLPHARRWSRAPIVLRTVLVIAEYVGAQRVLRKPLELREGRDVVHQLLQR